MSSTSGNVSYGIDLILLKSSKLAFILSHHTEGKLNWNATDTINMENKRIALQVCVMKPSRK